MTSNDGLDGVATAGTGRVKARWGTAAIGLGLLGLTLAMAAPGAQASNPAATGFASEDGVEVQMLTGPTCTWTEGEKDRRHYGTRRENVVCDSEDKDWWHAAPTVAGGPAGELTFRWDTDAQPVSVRPHGSRNDDEQPFPGAVSISAVSIGDGCKNPCTITRAGINTGGITYIVEAQWGETSSTKYAVNVEG